MSEMEIVFVRTRHYYEPYIDFFRLVELSGFPICYVDEVDVEEDKVFIVSPMNGEYRPHIDNQSHKARNAHLVLWNIERPDGSAGSVGNYARDNRELIYQRHVDEVWVSDRRLADETTLRYVTLGSDYGLGEPSNEKKYIFCHMSYETNRRQTIYRHFKSDLIGPNCWPPHRDEVIKASKFALNVHQDHHPYQEPLRFALFASYGLPIVSETIYDSYPYSEQFMVFSGYDGLVGKMNQLLQDDYERWQKMGLDTRDRMCRDFQFGKMVRKALDGVTHQWR